MIDPLLKAIVFDVDGVLLRLTPSQTQAYVGAFERCFGITGIYDDWNAYKKRNDVEITREILTNHFGREADNREIERLLDDYISFVMAELAAGRLEQEVLPGAVETLDELAIRPGLCLALATANLQTVAELRLKQVSLWPRFHCGGFAQDGEDKSAILTAAIAKCGAWLGQQISPEEVLFLGDQPSDVRAARANGTRFIGVADSETQRAMLETAGATAIISQLSIRDLA